MKTLLVNGSPRKNGDTSNLVNELLKKLYGETLTVNCYSDKISPCVDCRKCRENVGCVIKDDMQKVYDFLKTCDNVVFATPVYFNQPTGRFLDFASRFQTYYSQKAFMKTTPELSAKKGGIILVGGGSGNPYEAEKTLRLVMKLVNVKDIFPSVVSHNTDTFPALEDEKAVSDLQKLVEFLNYPTK